MTLTDFLLARIAEDENEARWFLRLHDGPAAGPAPSERLQATLDWLAGSQRRVLAECEAKRRIVERLAPIVDGEQVAWDLAEVVLKDMALPYADHPDYDEDWRP